MQAQKLLRGKELQEREEEEEKDKVGLSRSKKYFIICFSESPSKMMKNAFISF